jgi:hypothetical protein
MNSPLLYYFPAGITSDGRDISEMLAGKKLIRELVY